MSDPAANRVAIVTDSTTDLDATLAKQHGITVVPLFVNFGDQRFRDGVDLSRDEFFRRMREGSLLPTTSQPTAAMFEDAYRPLVEAGRPIVSIHITQGLSGTINAARAAAEQFPGATIRLVDSLTVTGGCALLALHAAELAEAGRDADAIVAAIEGDKALQHGFCTLPDLTHVVRTGRIGKAQAALGGLLKIVPVLRIGKGEVEVEARVRTFARAQETIVESTVRDLGDVTKSRIMVMHAHAPESGRALMEMLRAKLDAEPAFLAMAEGGPAISTHAGEGAVAIFSIAG
jgi:DegV family protein with EDD domain